MPAQTFIYYPACGTCRKAKKWLEENHITFDARLIVEQNPTEDELKLWIPRSGLPIKKFFNTSGVLYKEMNLKDKLSGMTEEEQIRLLASNGKLVKRPLMVSTETVLVGFNEDEWSRALVNDKTYRVMFLCLGNICRSPMAEFVMKDMVINQGLEERFHIESAAVSEEELGNPVYPQAKAKLAEHGIMAGKHSAHQITPEEFEEFDYIIVMDRDNLRRLSNIVGPEKVADTDKVRMIMEFAGPQLISREEAPNVADPWFTRNFEIAYNDIVNGCTGLLKYLFNK